MCDYQKIMMSKELFCSWVKYQDVRKLTNRGVSQHTCVWEESVGTSIRALVLAPSSLLASFFISFLPWFFFFFLSFLPSLLSFSFFLTSNFCEERLQKQKRDWMYLLSCTHTVTICIGRTKHTQTQGPQSHPSAWPFEKNWAMHFLLPLSLPQS